MKNRKGFTLLEMMIVVVIIGILAAAALPMYAEYVKKSRTGEAKSALGDIRKSQLSYYDDVMLGNHAYAQSISALGWTLADGTTTGKPPAEYVYESGDTDSTATATDADAVPTGFTTMTLTHAGDISAS